MPEIPKKITIDRKQMKVFVDGVEFPWVITEEGPQVQDVASKTTIPTVALSIFAEDVEIVPADE